MRIEKQQQLMNGRRRFLGQGMTEYIIIVALIAVAAIAAVTFFGEAVQANFVDLGATLIGEDASQGQATAAGNTPTVTPGQLGKY